MGNCAETCRQTRSEEIWKEPEQFQLREIKNRKATMTRAVPGAKISVDRSGGGVGKVDGGGGGRVRVKIVLTKEELEMLLAQLGSSTSMKGGLKCNLQQVLAEIERGRRTNGGGQAVDVGSWKPSLDSIMEVPEVSEMERS